MKSIFPIVASGVGALLLAGSVACAAGRPVVHDMTIQLPGGGVEHIKYTGNVAPKIVLNAPADPLFAMPVDWAEPFAAFDALDTAMDRQMDAMLKQVRALEALAPPNGEVTDAALRNLPPGTTSYTWISTTSGKRSCIRTIKVSAPGDGGKPQVVSQSNGDCAGEGAASAATNPIQARWSTAPETERKSTL